MVLILMSGAFPSSGQFVRFAVGFGIAAVGYWLYDMGKLRG